VHEVAYGEQQHRTRRTLTQNTDVVVCTEHLVYYTESINQLRALLLCDVIYNSPTLLIKRVSAVLTRHLQEAQTVIY
jgi:hypothetical protein